MSTSILNLFVCALLFKSNIGQSQVEKPHDVLVNLGDLLGVSVSHNGQDNSRVEVQVLPNIFNSRILGRPEESNRSKGDQEKRDITGRTLDNGLKSMTNEMASGIKIKEIILTSPQHPKDKSTTGESIHKLNAGDFVGDLVGALISQSVENGSNIDVPDLPKFTPEKSTNFPLNYDGNVTEPYSEIGPSLMSNSKPSYSDPSSKCPHIYENDEVVLFHHPTNKHEFYACSYGKAYLFTCPAGLIFNRDLLVCDWNREL